VNKKASPGTANIPIGIPHSQIRNLRPNLH
jgi:hypothetical protein